MTSCLQICLQSHRQMCFSIWIIRVSAFSPSSLCFKAHLKATHNTSQSTLVNSEEGETKSTKMDVPSAL